MDVSCVTYQTEREWLAAREGGIGASEIPALFGVVSPRMNPDKARADLIARKAGLAHKPLSAASRRRVAAGKALEAYGLTLLGAQLQRPVTPCGYTLFRNPAFPFLAATPDAIVGGGPADEGAECKVLGPDALAPEWGEFSGYQGRWKWHPEAPLRVTLQAMAQMAASAMPRTHVIAVAGSDHEVWTLERDEELIQMIGAEVLRAMDEINAAREAAKEKTA